MKIVVNRCYGGFELSKAVYDELGIEWDGCGYIRNEDLGIESDNHNAYRADSKLIQAIEKIGEKESSVRFSKIEIVEIPDDVDWEIDKYYGYETIYEKHRSW